jgi:hypothetical protein
MRKQEKPLDGLAQFMPPGTFEEVAPYFRDHVIHLTITRHRESLHGDYRAPTKEHPYHRISVNATLNSYSFLITLLHELAHLTTTVAYGLKASPHGKEWKEEFRKVLLPFLGKGIFPENVEHALRAYLRNPAASTCTDPRLYKALAQHDASGTERIHADDIAVGQRFELGGRVFLKLEELRTRVRCREEKSGRIYFVQGIAMVKAL